MKDTFVLLWQILLIFLYAVSKLLIAIILQIKMNMKVYFLIFVLSFCTCSPANPNPFEDKEALIAELEHVQLMMELEVLIKSLDDEQLDKLENIINKDLDQASEFDMIVKELKAMGMDDEDIEDLGQLALLMKEFLEKVPMLEEKLGMAPGSNELLDNVQVKELRGGFFFYD